MRRKAPFAAVVSFVLAAASLSFAGNIALEGSDATAFHDDPTYTHQLFTYLQGGSSKPVLVLGGVPLTGLSAGQAVMDTNSNSYSLAGYNLSDYSAVYVESVGGCCTQADTKISAADQALIAAAEATGLNLSIENYGGGPAWGPMLPAAVDALPASDFGGITDYAGSAGGPTCTDGEVFTAFALSQGFTQPGALGCWEHQAYLLSAFSALGFNSLVTSDPAYFGGAPGSAFLAFGGTLGGGGSAVPEPSSWIMMGTGLLGLGGYVRRKINL